MNLPNLITLDSGSIHIRGDPAESTRRLNSNSLEAPAEKDLPAGILSP
jgi:hypothetical protein